MTSSPRAQRYGRSRSARSALLRAASFSPARSLSESRCSAATPRHSRSRAVSSLRSTGSPPKPDRTSSRHLPLQARRARPPASNDALSRSRYSGTVASRLAVRADVRDRAVLQAPRSASITVDARWATISPVTPTSTRFQRLLHEGLGVDVQRGQRVVQHQHRASRGSPAPAPAAAAGRRTGSCPVPRCASRAPWQVVDEARLCGVERLRDVILGGLRTPECEVSRGLTSRTAWGPRTRSRRCRAGSPVLRSRMSTRRSGSRPR